MSSSTTSIKHGQSNVSVTVIAICIAAAGALALTKIHPEFLAMGIEVLMACASLVVGGAIGPVLFRLTDLAHGDTQAGSSSPAATLLAFAVLVACVVGLVAMPEHVSQWLTNNGYPLSDPAEYVKGLHDTMAGCGGIGGLFGILLASWQA